MFKQTKPVISIIIPVYNTSIYLEKCLNSIHNQSFKDYEVICIDDGSSDNSLDILKKYEKILKNCKVISGQNKGVASVRNKGLEHACGEYIVFIDSDDFIEKDYLEKLYNESCKSNADVVICNFYRYYENLNLSIPVLLKKSKGLYSNHSILKSLIPDILIHSYLWNKLWKKELFNNLKFPNIKYEDISVMCDLFYKTKKVAIINDTLYYYRIRKTSIVRNYSISTQNDYFKSYGFIRLFLKNNELYNKYKLSFTLLSIKVFFVMFFINIFLINEYKDFKITLENFKSFYKFICHANSSKYDYSMGDLLDLNVLQKCSNTLINEKSTE